MELLGDVGHVELHFFPFGDNVSVSAKRFMVCPRRTIGSEIVLDATDKARVEAHFGLFRDSANLDAR